MELKIDSDFQSCLPELTKEEYTELEKSVISNGVLSPILIWNGYIVDGHNRYSILKAHRIENFPVREMIFKDKDHVILWILQNQLGRRNLNDNQRMAAAYKYKDAVERISKERQDEGRNKGRETRYSGLAPNGAKPNLNNKTSSELAKIANVGTRTMERFDYIQRHGNEEQKERARKGGQGNSVTAIVQEIKEEKTDTRKCQKCGRILPLEMFESNRSNWNGKMYLRNQCRECRKLQDGMVFDSLGNRIKPKHEYDHISDEDIVEMLHGNGESKEIGIEEIISSLMATLNNFVGTIKGKIEDDAEIIRKNGTKQVDSALDDAATRLLSLKEVYKR